MGITGANFMVAESGTVIVLENEGNGRLVSSLPRCHVVLAGMERVLETTADAAFMIEQLSLAAVGRELPSYVSWLSGPAADGDDGPEEFVVIVVDNGRSRIRESDEREILNCIRCGSCLTVCPVYSKVGGHAYGSVYGGPIGAVLTPLLTGMRPDEGRKLPFLSSLCGACTDAARSASRCTTCSCAIARWRTAPALASRTERAAWGAWSRAWSSPRLYRASARAGARSGPLARAFGPGRELAAGPRDAAAAEHEAVPPRWRDLDERPVIDAFIAAVQADGAAGARACPTPPPRALTSPALLGRDATLCFWSGDPVVMSIDPASLGREVAEPATAARHHRRGVRSRADGHARADLRRGPLARAPACCPTLHIARAAGRPRAGDARRGDRAASTPTACRAAMTLVTGASATSDIEKIRVTGAHGPRRVAVVVVG